MKPKFNVDICKDEKRMKGKEGVGIVAGFLAILASFGQVLRSCSKADDVARLGRYTKHADDGRYLRNMDDVMRAGKHANTLERAKVTENFIDHLNKLKRKNQAEALAPKLELEYLQKTDPSLAKKYENKLTEYQHAKNADAKTKLTFEALNKEFSSMKQHFDVVHTAVKYLDLVSKLFKHSGFSELGVRIEPKDTTYTYMNCEISVPREAIRIKSPTRFAFAQDTVLYRLSQNNNFTPNSYAKFRTIEIRGSSNRHYARDFKLGDSSLSFTYYGEPTHLRFDFLEIGGHSFIVEAIGNDSAAVAEAIRQFPKKITLGER